MITAPTPPPAALSEKTSAAMFFKYNTQLGPPYQVKGGGGMRGGDLTLLTDRRAEVAQLGPPYQVWTGRREGATRCMLPPSCTL